MEEKPVATFEEQCAMVASEYQLILDDVERAFQDKPKHLQSLYLKMMEAKGDKKDWKTHAKLDALPSWDITDLILSPIFLLADAIGIRSSGKRLENIGTQIKAIVRKPS